MVAWMYVGMSVVSTVGTAGKGKNIVTSQPGQGTRITADALHLEEEGCTSLPAPRSSLQLSTSSRTQSNTNDTDQPANLVYTNPHRRTCRPQNDLQHNLSMPHLHSWHVRQRLEQHHP